MTSGEPVLFALNASLEFGKKVSERLKIPLTDHEERDFEDGEHKSRPLANIRGRDVFIIQSLYSEPGQSVNDKLCRLLFFIGAVRDAAAGRITAVVPYLAYARKDRKTQPRDPVTTRYVAGLFEAVGTDHLLTLDVHNLAAFQNAFACRTDHLEAKMLFVRYFVPLCRNLETVVVSPDAGGMKRAEQFRQALEEALGSAPGAAFVEKYRSQGIVRGERVVGDVKDRLVVIIDDLISTGTTLARAASACRKLGARKIYAAATHALFTGSSGQILREAPLEQIVITDTVPPFRLDQSLVREKIQILDGAALVAEAIRRIHTGESIVELLKG